MLYIISTCKDELSKYEFVKPIEDIVNSLSLKYKVISYKKKIPGDADKVIITGTALKDFDYLNYLRNFEWIKEKDIPTLGICAGSQIIALIMGAKLKNKVIIGRKKIFVIKENPLINIGEHYSYFLISKVPIVPDKNIVAVYEDIPAIFYYGNKYGVTFHPEVFNENIIVNFIKKVY